MKRILIIMLRSVSMDEISDGKLYSSSDMVRADSLGCDGCHECCCHMGNSILLDPFDVYQMSQGLHVPAAALFNGQLQFVCDWHYFLKDLAKTSQGLSPELIKTLHSYILKVFYLTPYQDGSDFYDQFYMRLNDAKKLFL